MTDINANISIDIDSSAAISNLKRLETQINLFQRSINSANTSAIASQAAWSRQLLQSINATGQFNAKVVDVEDSVSRFSRTLDKNKFTLGEYTRLAASQMPGMSKVFRKEFDTIQQVAESRVKSIASQFIALRDTIDGTTRAIAITPTGLAKGYATDVAIATERQKIFNKLIDDGSTKLLNWGKNTQWAGRQLMVGFSIPLAALGTVAAKTFMEIDKANLALRRVYGDLSTTTAEINSNIEAVQKLGRAYTKYGISLAETTDIAARAAATGAQNETLLAATEETLRFATLGQIDYNQALDSTIALQTAFGISNDQLASKIDFLNAVENQTILTIDDMSLAIPRVATVVKGLGGDIEDLAVMMTAMREGGVSAENAANALKSGLASLINPTKRARESLAGMNIDIKAMVNANKGDLMGLITDFANATNALDEFSRQQVFEQVFGKYQYARMSALFTNITKDAGQAARAMELAGMSMEELAAISEKELTAIADTTTVKFQAALETLKIQIAPIGEAFLKGLTPIVELASKLLDAFNSLPDGIKNAVAITTAIVGGLGPVFLMLAGLVGNGVANIVKGIQFMRRSIARIKGDAEAFNYLSDAESAALLATEKLQGGTAELTSKLLLQTKAVDSLTNAYSRFTRVAGIAGGAMAAVPANAPVSGGKPAMVQPRRFASGGRVPGTGNNDTIPALLTPGESVITKQATQQYGPIIDAMNKGRLPGFNKGVTGVQYFGNKSQTGGPGGEVEDNRGLPKYAPVYGPGGEDYGREPLHRSHIAGAQSEILPQSFMELINVYDATTSEKQKKSIKKMIVETFDRIHRNQNVLTMGPQIIGPQLPLLGSDYENLSLDDRFSRIKSTLQQGRLTFLNPQSYYGITMGRSGYRNSYFLESGLDDYGYLQQPPPLPPVRETSSGGEAITLSQWEEQVARAKFLVDPKNKKYVQAIADEANKDQSKGPTSLEKIIAGAEDLIKEDEYLKSTGAKSTEHRFFTKRVEDIIRAESVDRTGKTIDEETESEIKDRAKKIASSIASTGVLQSNNPRAIAAALVSHISANNPNTPWFLSDLPENRSNRTLFRQSVTSTAEGISRLNRGKKRIYGILPYQPQTMFESLGVGWEPNKLIPKKEKMKKSNIQMRNKGGLIQYFSNNPDPVSQTKALTGKQKFLRRLLESWVGKPVSMDERAVTNVLRTMPGGVEGERYSAGPLYRGFYARSGDLLPPRVRELIETAKYGINEEVRQAAARELVGMEFATEPRSWTTDYDVSTRFGSHTMELPQVEGGQFGLSVNKYMPEGHFFANEQEFVPLEESGRRVILRVSSVGLDDPSGAAIPSGLSGEIPEGSRLKIRVERVTDLSNTKRRKMERELDERIIARRGSLLGGRSKEAKAAKRQEIVDYTGGKQKIRDEIFQWMQDIESGQRRYNSWSDWWTDSHEEMAHKLFGQENFREFQKAIDRDEWPERMPNIDGSTRKQTLEIIRKIREKGMQGANLGGLIQRFADGGDVAAFMNNPIFQSDKRRYVPGVGNTDTVPAMLTPGEFVINKRATAENLPLLRAINDGKSVGMNRGGYIRGIQYFADAGEVRESPKMAYSPSQSHLTPIKVVSGEEALAYARLSGQQAVKAMVDEVEKGLIQAENVRARLYTNAIINEPYLANEEMMMATESAKLFRENPKKVAEPLVTGITDALEKSSVTLSQELMDEVDKVGLEFVSGLASEYEKFGDEIVSDVDRERAARRVFERIQGSGSVSRPVIDAMGRVFDEATAAFFTVNGKELLTQAEGADRPSGIGRVAIPSRGTTRLKSYRSRSISDMPDWKEELPSTLTPEGDIKRREQELRRLEVAQSRSRRRGMDAAEESLKASNQEVRMSKRKRKRLAYEERINRAMEKRMAQLGPEPSQPSAAAIAIGPSAYEVRKYQEYQDQVTQIRKDAEQEVERDMQRSREQRRREDLREQGRQTAIRIAQQRKALEDAGVSRAEATRQAREMVMMPGIPETAQTEEDVRRMPRESRRERIQRHAGKLFGVGAGMQALSMVPYMAQNEQGQFMGMNANMLGAGLALGGTAAELLPMLTRVPPQILGVAAAVAVLAGGFVALKKGIDNNIEAGRRLADSLTTTVKEQKAVAEIFGTTILAERRLAKERQKLTGLTTREQEIGKEFVQTDQGKSMVEEAKIALEKEGAAFSQNLGTQLSQMVISGALTPTNAKAVALGISDALGREDLAVEVTAQINRILGLSGEDITNTPMQIIANVKASLELDEKRLQSEAEATASSYGDYWTDNFLNLGSLYSGEYDALIRANVAYYETFIENTKSILSSIDDEIMRQEDLIKTINKKIKAEDDADKKQELRNKKNEAESQRQQLITQKQLVANQRRQQAMNLLQAGGNETLHVARQRIEEQYGINALEEMFRGGLNFGNSLKGIPGGITGGIGAIAYEQRQNLFGTEEQLNNLEVSMLVDMELGNIDVTALKAVEMMASNDSLTAQTRIIPFALDAYVNKDFETMNKILGYSELSERVRINIDPVLNKMDAKTTADFLDILSLVPEDIQIKIGTQLGKNPETIKTFLSDIKELQSSGINVADLLSKGGVKGIQEAAKAITDISANLKKFAKEIESLNKINDKNKKVQATADVMSKLLGIDISPEQINQYIQDLITSSGLKEKQIINLPGIDLVNSVKMTMEASAVRAQATNLLNAARMIQSKDLAKEAERLFAVADAIESAAGGAARQGAGIEKPADGGGSGGGGGGGDKSNPFKDLKKSITDRLKMFTDFAALMKKYKSSKDGFMKAVQEATMGRGVAGKLRNLGLDENFVQDILSSGLENAQKVLDKLQQNRRQAKALNLAYIKGAAGEELSGMEADTKNTKTQIRAFTKIERFNAANPNQQIPDYVRDAIASSPALSALATKVKVGSKDWNTMVDGIKAYTQEAEKLANLEDPYLAQEEMLNLMKRQHELTTRANKERIKGLQDQISEIDKQIAAINRLNEKDQDRIRDLQREKEIRQREIDAIQKTIDSMQRANEMDERRIERLRREDAIRNRIAEALSNDLEIMSQQEETIRKQYQERIDALEEVNKLNDHIVESQKQQLGLAQALSQGDVYAAAAAAQEMQASQGQYAREQQTVALQQGMENQISGLTTPGGLTRQQAEEQINAIRQQSYQTSLQIRDIEDVIYQRNLDMIPLKDQIYNKTLLQQGTDAAILAIQDLIYNRETEILKLKESQEPIQARLRNEEDILKTMDDQFNSTYDSAMALIEQDKITEALNKGTIALTKNWNNVGKAINNANQVLNNTLAKLGDQPKPEDYPNTAQGRAAYKAAMDQWKESRNKAIEERNAAVNSAMSEGRANDASIRAGMYAGGSVKKYPMGGSVIGAGARDSVKAMLTPGEFVIRKSMVDKYGIPMLNKMNMGSLPRYQIPNQLEMSENVQRQALTIISPTYGDTGYNNISVNVNVPNTNASPDAIANKVAMKIQDIDRRGIGNGRVYKQ